MRSELVQAIMSYSNITDKSYEHKTDYVNRNVNVCSSYIRPFDWNTHSPGHVCIISMVMAKVKDTAIHGLN